EAESDAVAAANKAQRPALCRLWRDVQYNGARRSPAHTAVRQAHHVLDPLPGQLFRDGDIASLVHAGRSDRANMPEDQDVIGCDIQRLIVYASAEIFQILKYDGPSLVLHQALRTGGSFDDSAARRDIAV